MTELLAILGLAAACGVWVVIVEAHRRIDPAAAERNGRCGGCTNPGPCKKEGACHSGDAPHEHDGEH